MSRDDPDVGQPQGIAPTVNDVFNGIGQPHFLYLQPSTLGLYIKNVISGRWLHWMYANCAGTGTVPLHITTVGTLPLGLRILTVKEEKILN